MQERESIQQRLSQGLMKLVSVLSSLYVIKSKTRLLPKTFFLASWSILQYIDSKGLGTGSISYI